MPSEATAAAPSFAKGLDFQFGAQRLPAGQLGRPKQASNPELGLSRLGGTLRPNMGASSLAREGKLRAVVVPADESVVCPAAARPAFSIKFTGIG